MLLEAKRKSRLSHIKRKKYLGEKGGFGVWEEKLKKNKIKK